MIEAYNKAPQQPRGKYFRPSMIHSCDRANVFHYLNSPYKPPPQTAKMQRTLDVGTKLHEMIQEYLAHSYEFYFVKEARSRLVFGDAMVQGSTDGVLIHRATNKRYCVEIKTMEGVQFRSLSKEKPEHVKQAMNYAIANDCEGIILLYWDKNRSLIKQFYVPISGLEAKKTRAAIEKRVTKLKAYADAFDDELDPDKLPPYDRSSCYKAFCGYVKYCRKQGAPV